MEKYHFFWYVYIGDKVSQKVSKELIEFKKILEENEIEIYINDVIEELNLDFLIDYVYGNEFILEDCYTLSRRIS